MGSFRAGRIGARVVIIRDDYNGKTVGMMGTIKSTYYQRLAIELDELANPRSSYNCFYYTESQVRPTRHEDFTEDFTQQTEKEYAQGGVIKMEKKTGNYRIAIIHFMDGNNKQKGYEYACYDDLILEGDKVVVMSAHHGIGVAEVTAFVDNRGQDIYREIICRADFSAYEERVAKRAEQKELLKLMQKRSAELQELTLYETLAKADPEMAELLKQYKNI